MKSVIYKITFDDDKTIITNDRLSIAREYNRLYCDKENFKPFNINTINGMLYNHNKMKKNITSFERIAFRDYYKKYVDQYVSKLEMDKKPYKNSYINNRTNNVLNMIFDVESHYINNSKDINEMEQRIQQIISIS